MVLLLAATLFLSPVVIYDGPSGTRNSQMDIPAMMLYNIYSIVLFVLGCLAFSFAFLGKCRRAKLKMKKGATGHPESPDENR